MEGEGGREGVFVKGSSVALAAQLHSSTVGFSPVPLVLLGASRGFPHDFTSVNPSHSGDSSLISRGYISHSVNSSLGFLQVSRRLYSGCYEEKGNRGKLIAPRLQFQTAPCSRDNNTPNNRPRLQRGWRCGR